MVEKEEANDEIEEAYNDIMEAHVCEEHPNRACYTKRGQHQTLDPLQVKMWANLVVSHPIFQGSCCYISTGSDLMAFIIAQVKDREKGNIAYNIDSIPAAPAFAYRPSQSPMRPPSSNPSDQPTAPVTPIIPQFPAYPFLPTTLPYAGYPFGAYPTPPKATTTQSPVLTSKLAESPTDVLEGPEMDIDSFGGVYNLQPSILEALKREEALSPADINHLTYDDYIKDIDKKGLGLKLGTAQRLVRAMKAWRDGVDFQGNPLN